jgi:hypothetical protein
LFKLEKRKFNKKMEELKFFKKLMIYQKIQHNLQLKNQRIKLKKLNHLKFKLMRKPKKKQKI